MIWPYINVEAISVGYSHFYFLIEIFVFFNCYALYLFYAYFACLVKNTGEYLSCFHIDICRLIVQIIFSLTDIFIDCVRPAP